MYDGMYLRSFSNPLQYLVETIQKSIELNKIPNAYIFTGIRGGGKTTTARIVAKM